MEVDPNIPVSEMMALQDLYNATDGDHWYFNPDYGSKWNFNATANPCMDDWQGIDCSLPSPYNVYHVVNITLDDTNLRGKLPYSLGNFSNLSHLRLQNNLLSGTMPSTLGNLSQLQHLDLGGNILSGSIPESFCSLSKIRYLSLSNYENYEYNNNLTGTLPAELVWNNHTQILIVGNNRLQGNLPDAPPDWVPGSSQLSVLLVDNNFFSGLLPLNFSQLTSLTMLVAEYNFLSGPLDGKLSTSSLSIAGFGYNLMTGTLPAELLWSSNLIALDVSSNYLHGALPDIPQDWVPSSSKLQQFTALHNLFSGSLPHNFSQLTELVYLGAARNYLSGSVDAKLPTSLQILDLRANQFTGTLDWIGVYLNQLTTLELGGNCFHGTIPTEYCNQVQLRNIVLSCLCCAPACRTSILHNSAFIPKHPVSGTIPACLFSLPKLSDLSLSYNSLTGSLPYEQSFPPSLSSIDLSYNLLTGRVPRQIVNALDIYEVELNNNRFSGELRFSAIADEVEFDTEYNRLSGYIPQSVVEFSYSAGSDYPHVLEGNLFACNSKRSDLPRSPTGE